MDKNRRESISSLAIALLFSANALAYTIGNFSLNKVFYLISFGMMIVTIRKIIFTKVEIYIFLLTLFQFFLYFISNNEYDMTKTYMYYFLFFFIYFFLACSEEIKSQKIIFFLTIFLSFCIPLILKVILLSDFFDIGYLLGISYAFLPLYLSSIITYGETNSLLIKLLSLFNIILFGYFYLTNGNRGAVFCIILFLLFKSLFSREISLKKKYGIVSLLTVIFIIIYTNIVFILTKIHEVLVFFGINIYAIEKSISLLESNQNFDSGRGFLINKGIETLDGLKDVFLGKGIGFYENEFNTYTHNVFFQYFIEGGLIYMSILILFILTFINYFFKVEKELNTFFCVILAGCLIPLTLSNVYWLNPMYWFSMVYILKNFPATKKKFRLTI